VDGVLVIDKPAGYTSHDVVARVRRIVGTRSVGHLGTLDPMATGVLPLVVGRMTRLAQFYTDSDKAYEGTIRLGVATDTYDADGDPVGAESEVKVTLEELREAAKKYVGRIQQMPPPFSAKKIKGVPAYRLARKDKPVELKPVEVEVREFEITGLEGPVAAFRAIVSSGTYVRSIAHELGQVLGTGGHLARLKRTRVGEFGLADAVGLDRLEAAQAQGTAAELFLHPRKLLPLMPAVTATDDDVARISHGMAVNLADMSRSKYVKVFRGQADLICIAQRVAGSLFHPKVVLLGQ
jgi:tRNA pseudouridine55 synthase